MVISSFHFSKKKKPLGTYPHFYLDLICIVFSNSSFLKINIVWYYKILLNFSC